MFKRGGKFKCKRRSHNHVPERAWFGWEWMKGEEKESGKVWEGGGGLRRSVDKENVSEALVGRETGEPQRERGVSVCG